MQTHLGLPMHLKAGVYDFYVISNPTHLPPLAPTPLQPYPLGQDPEASCGYARTSTRLHRHTLACK